MNMHTGIGTPLQLAAGKGLLDLVKLLVEKGADPLIKDPRGKIALDRAKFDNYTEVVEFLSPLSVPSSVPRHDFSDKEGFHYHLVPLTKFLGAGWDKIHYPRYKWWLIIIPHIYYCLATSYLYHFANAIASYLSSNYPFILAKFWLLHF
jgi:FOG: Ankyrin repeat